MRWSIGGRKAEYSIKTCLISWIGKENKERSQQVDCSRPENEPAEFDVAERREWSSQVCLPVLLVYFLLWQAWLGGFLGMPAIVRDWKIIYGWGGMLEKKFCMVHWRWGHRGGGTAGGLWLNWIGWGIDFEKRKKIGSTVRLSAFLEGVSLDS